MLTGITEEERNEKDNHLLNPLYFGHLPHFSVLSSWSFSAPLTPLYMATKTGHF
jgi:hypothetical protein